MTDTTTQAPPQPAQPQMDQFRVDLLNRIGSADDPGPLKASVFGPEGVGKTVWCCQAKNCFLIDVEKGRRSIANHPDLMAQMKNRILKVRNFNDMEETVWAIREGDIQERIQAPIDTIIIDTMTTLVAGTTDQVMEKVAAENNNRSIHYPSQAERVLVNSLIRKMTVAFTDLDQNLIIVSHQDWVKDEDSGRMMIGPMLSPKIAQTVRSIVDFQGRMTAEDLGDGHYVRWLQAHPTKDTLAKCRIGGVPVKFDASALDINKLIKLHQSVLAAA
ncbi:MAG: AAA family ATPase [Nitrososphaeraceae archaeon]